MNPTSILEILSLALGITKKILDRMPSYAQSKKEELYELTKNFETEIAKDFDDRDDNLCDIYRRDLLLFLRSFSDEISGADVAPVRLKTDQGAGVKK